MTAATTVEIAIRPFRFEAPEDDLVDLRGRLQATRWPDNETVKDESQGAQLAKLQALVGYWGRDYNWRKVEARLNAFHEVDRGGHFAAWEQPQLFSEEIRRPSDRCANDQRDALPERTHSHRLADS